MLNVAVWFGAGVFFTLGVAPAFFTPEMKSMLGEQSYPVFSGRLAMVVVSRYFMLHYWCGSIALLHQLAERFYLGKALQRFNFGLLIGICSFSLLGGIWLQPSLRKLHEVKYGRPELYSPPQKAQAAQAFRTWHGVSWAMNLLVLAGLGTYLWRVTYPEDGPQFVPTGKFRS
jgi:hypothetical protein